jgi:hypothetical protein
MAGLGISYYITHIKQPAERLPIDISFGKLHVLPRGAKEIISADVSAKRWPRKSPDDVELANDFIASSNPLTEESTPSVTILNPNKTSVRFVVEGGESGYDYEVTVLVTFDNGAKLEEEVFIRVREE